MLATIHDYGVATAFVDPIELAVRLHDFLSGERDENRRTIRC